MNEDRLKEKLLGKIHAKTGWGNPLRPHCEIETLSIKNVIEGANRELIVDFRYIFDEDGFSQYDKTHVFDGYVTIDDGNFIAMEIEEIHAGVATIRKYNP